MKPAIVYFFFFLLSTSLFSQEEKVRNWSLNGYLKDLQSVYFLKDVDAVFQDNLLHNRLNFRWNFSPAWQLRADLRSRILWGDLVRVTPDYLAQVNDGSDDFFDLSLGYQTDKGLILHTTIDRLYFEYSKDQWELRLGRQRINWGINTIWNPNDIFNAYSFTDFDYEERPGSDALRLRYFTGFASGIEVAVRAFDRWEEAVAAALVKFNKWETDFQLLGGVMENNLVFGGGWAGSLGNAGFKGEFSYFHGLADSLGNNFTATLGVDYSFKKGLYLNAGLLFNGDGNSGANTADIFTTQLSARNLYPYQWAILAQSAYPITPLLNAGVAVIYSPSDVHALFINPSLSYSLQQNWDLNLIGQLAFDKSGTQYESLVSVVFLRLKWSF